MILFEVDFEWEEWSAWSACSVSCGNGIKKKSRGCKSSEHGGQDCPRDDLKDDNDYRKTQPCFIKKCPGKRLEFNFMSSLPLQKS